MTIWGGFVLGFLGSMHCVGMCGPIVFALPKKEGNRLAYFWGGSCYNLGRAITYMLIGMIFGLLGQGFSMVGIHRWIGIGAGLFMIAAGIFPKFYTLFSFENNTFVRWIQKKIGRLFRFKSYTALFTIGLLNGALPCGMVYAAIAAALALGNVIESGLFMLLFGLGTFPIMLLIFTTGSMVGMEFRKKMTKFASYILILLGVLFVLRGLGLGIPFISPPLEVLEISNELNHKCH